MKRVLIASAVVIGLWSTSALAQNIDHYLCWQYKGSTKLGTASGGPIAVTDQFVTNGQVDGKKMRYYCNPALKNDTNLGNLLNPNDHLACYVIKPVHATTPAITGSDQFINEPLSSKNKAKLFCLPSSKS
jgi:hypothetical protein